MNPLQADLEAVLAREVAARTNDWLRRFPEEDAKQTADRFEIEVRQELMQ